MPSEEQQELREKLREGLHVWDGIRCSQCETVVDLSGADSLSEAGELWNDHLRACDGIEAEMGDAKEGEWITY